MKRKRANISQVKAELMRNPIFYRNHILSPFNYDLLRSSNNLTSKYDSRNKSPKKYLLWMLYNEHGNDKYLHFHTER